jgi:hypothetical protein
VEEGTGYLSYQWYEVGVGALSDDTYISGTASTGPVGTAATLTLSNLITPTDNQRKFYVTVDYVASAYGTGRSTGNAWNEPLTSGIATATVTPLIEVIAQPTEAVTAEINNNVSISVNADLTDSDFADDITYQWYLNGEVVTDGTKTTTTTTGANVSATVEHTYTSDGNHQFPAVAIDDVELIVASGSGGNGGYDGGGPGGDGGVGRVGRFSLSNSHFLGKLINLYIGNQGNAGKSGNSNAFGQGGAVTGGGDGGRGGGAGNRGWSGGGGGGGAASYVTDPTGKFVVVGGGGGGGGGSHNIRGLNGGNAEAFSNITGNVPIDAGEAGGDNKSDGGGGGGGGGGRTRGSGGNQGVDNSRSSEGGEGGTSGYDSDRSTILQQWNNEGGQSGYANLKYTGYTDTTVTTVRNTVVSGTDSNTLTIRTDTVGVQTCQCKITSATASNSPIWTDVSNFVASTTVEDNNIIVEGIGVGQTASLSSINLNNGDYTFDTSQSQVSTGSITKYYSIYSPDKDITVEMDLYGGKGDDKGSYTGGEGGYSRIRFSMGQNQEYVIVGLSTDSVNTPFLYRRGVLIACVGQGGDAGTSGNGGAGGGVNNEGQDGRGMNSGNAQDHIARGNLGADGIFGSLYPSPLLYPGDSQATGQNGGRTIRCTKGVFWAQNGASACNDMGGTTQFRLPDGTLVENSAEIIRGFKAGYNIMETGGSNESTNGGVGGNGATGGNGGSQGGGGGGSGYQDGSIDVVDTQLGGSTENAKVVLRVVS